MPQCVIQCPEHLTGGEYPSFATYYRYNALGKMVEVTQGVQKRWFKYDSLGRLIRVRQPEQEINPALNLSDTFNTSGQWTAGFTYDVLGNVLTATDANGVTITNTYDQAGRVKTRTYSGEPQGQTTPTVSFYYDGKGLAAPQSPNFAKGKLTKVTSSVSETSYTQFDNLGRLLSTEQRTPLDGQTVAQATPYVSSYVYNFSGALVEETYPSGRKVRNEFESDGDLLNVASKKSGGSVFTPYVSNFSYTASGGISQMRLGNGKWETAKFNNRMQVTELGLGNSATDASAWKVNYDYGELQTNGTVDAAKNTGNIARQTLTVPGTSFIQSYKYDSLYRLTEAVEKTGTTTNWSQRFGYDRYGNRTGIDQAIGQLTLTTTPTVDANTNRFVTTGTNFQYDLNGNLVRDAEGRQFTFNVDNKQTVVKDASGNPIGQYFYDGEGKRVKKITNTETTVFVYSSGKLIAEYSTQLSQSPSINYTTTDHLGSPRVITDALGQVKSRRDFMPFGEDLYMGVGGRSESLKYGSTDDIKQKFTGYLKDNETGLDFAEARMYENRHGRFTAVDPLLASGKSPTPQSFNRYIYVGNNPIVRIDPSGKIWVKAEDGKANGQTAYRIKWVRGNTAPKGWTALEMNEKGYAAMERYNKNKLIGTEIFFADKNKSIFRALPKKEAGPQGGLNDNAKALIHDLGKKKGPALQVITGALAFPALLPALAPVGAAAGAGAAACMGSGACQTGAGIGIGIGAGYGATQLVPDGGANPGSGGLSPELTGQLTEIYARYPADSFQCECASNEALQAFQGAGMGGNIVQITMGTDFIVTSGGTTIGTSGFHQAVQVGDLYYDALTGSSGVTWEQYQKLFIGPIQQVPVRPFIPPDQ